MVMPKGQQAFDTYECNICCCEKCITNIGLVEDNAVSKRFFYSSQSAFTCWKLTIKTLEQSVKYV